LVLLKDNVDSMSVKLGLPRVLNSGQTSVAKGKTQSEPGALTVAMAAVGLWTTSRSWSVSRVYNTTICCLCLTHAEGGRFCLFSHSLHQFALRLFGEILERRVRWGLWLGSLSLREESSGPFSSLCRKCRSKPDTAVCCTLMAETSSHAVAFIQSLTPKWLI
jgi:hypothetical protein